MLRMTWFHKALNLAERLEDGQGPDLVVDWIWFRVGIGCGLDLASENRIEFDIDDALVKWVT